MDSSKLFKKIILNNKVEISNRLTIAPMALFASTSDGSMIDEEREYLKFMRNRYRTIYTWGINYK